MLTRAVESYVEIRRAAGFDLFSTGHLLQNFARFATEQGDTHVRASTAIAWAKRAPSERQRSRRLKFVIRFSRYVRAEDAEHEVPPDDVFAAPHVRRLPYIFTPEDVRRIVEEAGQVGPEGSLRPQTYRMLFGLLASCGLRISEALALWLEDVTVDGLVIRKTKFHKSRLVPLHPSTERAMEAYLRDCRKLARRDEFLFVSMGGGAVPYVTARATFLAVVRKLGIRGAPGDPGPCLHGLRHAFVIRSLENCPRDRVASHMLALSTYLGHAHIADTYWYLQMTPQLTTGIADACQGYLRGETL